MRLQAPIGGFAVRMYRHGLGDCFLLAFGTKNQKQTYMLIDCGVLLGTPNADVVMQDVVKDIGHATGDHLDVLVITHEHWDHVSGFMQAQSEFNDMKVDQVWLAWTEDPSNPLARELINRRKAALKALGFALDRVGPSPSLYASRIKGLGEFFGPDLGVVGGVTTEQALDWVKNKWNTPRYCEPGGEPLRIPGLPDVNFFVLGPPSDPKFIRKSSPSGRAGEVYLGDVSGSELELYLKGLDATEKSKNVQLNLRDRGAPFNQAYEVAMSDDSILDINQRYHSETWRSIETEWLGAAGDLALQLDAHTNNTSLVLAVELSSGRNVLLFPGDAQVGNWLSWDNVRWSGAHARITTADLLSRTVLYKVAHHGSHNATLRNQGLERMASSKLLALIPVNRQMAAKKNWRMPYKPLLERIAERTLGKLVLSDGGLPKANGDASVQEFLKSCTETPLYVEVKGSGPSS